MRIENDVKLDYGDVLLKPKRSRLLSRSKVDITRDFRFPHSTLTWKGIPIIAANMDTVGTFIVAEVLSEHGMLTCIHKHYTIADWVVNTRDINVENLIPSFGMGESEESRYDDIVAAIGGSTFICLDVANGYSEAFADWVSHMRSKTHAIIIAGNVATPEMTEQLILSGADVVKIGIGPGSACTTRKVTGVGYPQLSAVAECADAAHGLNGHIVADGGCSTPGDVAKAFCAGADFVMLGGMLAGHDETGTEFYGMSSNKAQSKYSGDLKYYRASEGRELIIEPKGPLQNTIREILGGVRSACTYIGASELRHAPKCATFIRVNNQYNTMYGT